MSVKLLALDMDGTLLDSKKNLPKDFIPWVINHPEIKTVISSGRQYYTLKNQFIDIADKLIFLCENGSVVYQNDEVIYENPMSKEEAKSLLNYIDNFYEYGPIVCGMNSAYVLTDDPEIIREAKHYYARLQIVNSSEELYELMGRDKIFKMALFIKNRDAESVYNSSSVKGEGLDRIIQTLSGDSWIDYSLKTVNKGVALTAIEEYLGISYEDSMAFGDYLNDIELLQAVGQSWAMKNAHPDIKQIAKNITEFTNDEDGVMKTLKKAGL